MKYLELLLNNLYIEYLLRILMALILGVIIGSDRNKKGAPAGVKTHSLVCMGAALVMITSDYLYRIHMSGDITRMSAQVISGIGFLGAGTIILTGKNRIKGLTTAAAIWFCACIGITVGAGFYFGGIVATILEMLILTHYYRTASTQQLEVLLEYSEDFKMIELIKHLKMKDIHVMTFGNSNMQSVDINGKLILVTVTAKGEVKRNKIIEAITEVKGVIDAVEIA